MPYYLGTISLADHQSPLVAGSAYHVASSTVTIYAQSFHNGCGYLQSCTDLWVLDPKLKLIKVKKLVQTVVFFFFFVLGLNW